MSFWYPVLVHTSMANSRTNEVQHDEHFHRQFSVGFNYSKSLGDLQIYGIIIRNAFHLPNYLLHVTILHYTS